MMYWQVVFRGDVLAGGVQRGCMGRWCSEVMYWQVVFIR